VIMPAVSTLLTFVVSGLLGSLGHCLGMCGPLNVMVGTQIRASALPAVGSFGLYHAARISVYVVLGIIVGAIGSLMGMSRQLSMLNGVVSLVIGMAILLIGLGYLGWLPTTRIEGAAHWWNTALSRALKTRGGRGVIVLGALNGLLPCGLVYSALLLAASTGSPWSAAVGMGLFGLGTFPALFVVDLSARALTARFRQVMVRLAGILMILIGLQLVLRGGAALGVWPHLKWGSVPIW
jgi:sulfite exporter TauE/SafE